MSLLSSRPHHHHHHHTPPHNTTQQHNNNTTTTHNNNQQQQPTTNGQPPTANHQPPTTNHKPHQQPTTPTTPTTTTKRSDSSVTARTARFPFLQPQWSTCRCMAITEPRGGEGSAVCARVVATRAADGGCSPGHVPAPQCLPWRPRTAKTRGGSARRTTRLRSGRCLPQAAGAQHFAMDAGEDVGEAHRCLRCCRRSGFSSAPQSSSSTLCLWSRCSTTLCRRW